MPATLDIVFAVLFSVVLIFNIAGNSLVIYIIANERGMKTSTNYLLLNLAVADLLFGIFLAPEFIFLPFFHHSIPDGGVGDWLCKLLLNSNNSWMVSKACHFTTVTLSVERYFAVCHPHTFRQRFSMKIVTILAIVSWIYSGIHAIPLFLYSRWNQEYFMCYVSAKGHNVYTLIETISFSSLMVLVLAKICRSLWCKNAIEATGQREITERKKKKKVTVCVIAVVITSVVCWLPLAVSYFLVAFSPGTISTEKAKVIILVTSVNAALDPYLFSFQSSRFKHFLNKILCCKKGSSE